VLTTICGLALASGVFAVRAQADQWNKKTILTVNEPIQVQERLLQPGTYVFKLLDSSSTRHIVQIFNADQSHLIDTVLAIPNYRLEPTGHSQFSFYETPAGTARALHAWFYPGDNFGQEFPYPKHNIVLQASADRAATVARASMTIAPPAEPPAETPVAQPQAEAAVPETQAENAPVEIAEAAPPPAPAPAAPAPPEPAPERLPKTGSSYPMIGLFGLLSLGLYGLVRLTRTA
jgi:LPXTG-motif cell wall-anchored protein